MYYMQIIESTNTTSWWLRFHFPGLWGESRLFSAEYMRYRGNRISLCFSYLGSANADFRDLPSSQERLCILVQTRKSIFATSRMSAFYLLGGSFLLRCPALFGGCGNAGASFGRENPLLLLWGGDWRAGSHLGWPTGLSLSYGDR
jgi:hypothetical protein